MALMSVDDLDVTLHRFHKEGAGATISEMWFRQAAVISPSLSLTWIPAPPPESLPAMVSTEGTDVGNEPEEAAIVGIALGQGRAQEDVWLHSHLLEVMLLLHSLLVGSPLMTNRISQGPKRELACICNVTV
jgi:hypothetical protein